MYPTSDTFEFFGYPLDILWLFTLKFSICHTSLNIWVKIEKPPPPPQDLQSVIYKFFSINVPSTIASILLP